MGIPQPNPPFRLRQLPLPAKLVLSVFLIAVGLGYFSALVQLHLQHSSRRGEPMPTLADVIEKFAGVKPADGAKPQSKLEGLVSGDPDSKAWGKTNMTPAFYEKSGSDYKKAVAAGGKEKDHVVAERDGERRAFVAWLNSSEPGDQAGARKEAYDKDLFVLPDPIDATQRITEEFVTEGPKKERAVKIASLIEVRCQKCHVEGNQNPALDDYSKLAPLATAPKPELIAGKWVRSGKQMTVEGLTQSTHAHLLSFAVLFALTGLIFSFTGFPAVVRATLGPVVLLAQVADVACWWLARIDGVGPYFAMMIVVNGTIVGFGLVAHILGSLFSMYGAKGKVALSLLLGAMLTALGVLGAAVIKPALEAEAKAAAAAEPPKEQPKAAAAEKPEPVVLAEPKQPASKPAEPEPAAEEKASADRPAIPRAADETAPAAIPAARE